MATVKTPIFAIDPEPLALTMATTPWRRARRQGGFTLIELLVVFAISALLIAIVPLAYERVRESAQYRQVLRDMMTGLRQARQLAITQGDVVRFRVDLAQRSFAVDGRPDASIDEPLRVRAVVGDTELQAGQIAAIAFLPDGGGTGGSIELIRPSGGGARLRVDWLTGQITQEALLP